jgi:AGCS family alanine or glycine:cation symporter
MTPNILKLAICARFKMPFTFDDICLVMISQLFDLLNHLENLLWSSLAVPLLLVVGIFFTFRLRVPQLRQFPQVVKEFFHTLRHTTQEEGRGITPIRAFFASIGGCIGIGNVVAVCTAIKLGGPGALFWMWVAAFLGMSIKYAEVYLGIKFRIQNRHGSYDGGPMYYLQKAFGSPHIPAAVALLLAFSGTEVFIFKAMTSACKIIAFPLISYAPLKHGLAVTLLLLAILHTSSGGMDRIGKVSSYIIPLFLLAFVGMVSWVLLLHRREMGEMLALIFRSAFTGHAAVGGFAGSSLLLTISQGITRACYSGDIGIGYAAMVHAESNCTDPKKQARMVILDIFIDTFVVCTATTLVIFITGVWQEDIPASAMVHTALARYFPYMHIFMPLFIITLGYSSLTAFFGVGLKCANFLHPAHGSKIYYGYAICSWILFSLVDESDAMTAMSIAAALLLCFNVVGIFRLRKEVEV